MKSVIRAAVFLMGISGLAGVAVAQSVAPAERSEASEPSFEATQIVFKPGAGKVGLSLSVVGPDGFQFSKGYPPGVDPAFSVSDLDDGLYSFELRIAPTTDSDDAGMAGDKRAEVAPSERGLRENAGPPQDTIVESGHFRVEAGSLVLKNVVERGGESPPSELELTGQTGLAEKAVCHSTDLIVEGSLCVGVDCACSTSFGFDTIVLRENNLRIFFDDTSTLASFPRNDWRIVINDSSNGGESYFGIDDSTAGRRVFAIEAGARSNSLYVDAGGDVGLGTSIPVVNLHIRDGNTPTLRLEQDGSAGFTPQTWDLAGNEANFFIRDATGGSTLPFRIQPGAPSDLLTLRADEKVGIGTWSPDSKLHVVANAGVAARVLHLENDAGVQFDFENTATSESWRMVNSGVAGSSTFIITNLTHAGAELTVEQDGDLLVQGTISSGGTTLNVPDYVFEADYNLPSMGELAAFVAENKHLPNVPSADELKVNGLNHSEFQMRLLEKVEELTLYTIQQQNTIDELLKRLVELEESSGSLQ